MARRKEERQQAVTDERLKGILRELDMAEQAVADERETVKDIMDNVKAVGVHGKALKLALRLSKRSAAEQNDFLKWFGKACGVLGVGMQREMPFEEDNVVSIQQS